MLPCAAAIELYLREIDASGGGVDAVMAGRFRMAPQRWAVLVTSAKPRLKDASAPKQTKRAASFASKVHYPIDEVQL